MMNKLFHCHIIAYTTDTISSLQLLNLVKCEPFVYVNNIMQGGILSPWFLNVYIDDLSIALSNSKYGCTFGGCSVNHLSYADDMVILSPSATHRWILPKF